MTDRDVTSAEPVLAIRDLSVGLRARSGVTELIRGVSLDIRPGERVGLVGESGSGKSLTMLAVMGLLASPVAVTGGSVTLGGTQLVGASDRTLRALRGSEIAMVYQDPMTSLDPLQRVGEQIAEGLRAHGVSRHEASERTVAALAEVQLPDPARLARSYPHELSGGMRQRVMIAAALAGNPRLLLADEPTTALDVTIQRQILSLVARIQRARNLAVLWVTHDLGVAAQFVQRLAVMYAGRVVEVGPTTAIFSDPQHPYTAALLDAVPSTTGERAALGQIPGSPPEPGSFPAGCSFASRCRQALPRCTRAEPILEQRPSGVEAACFVPPAEWRA
ncbi:MAG TPA: ABC transporter ATP-binding protein [Streptosporangiaceae bacterium]|nr:ABC transporter ATP-binding protein [Streptosporangiaceae bacterium]